MGTVGQYMGQKGPVINQHDVTDAYRERYPFAGTERERWLRDGEREESFAEWKNRQQRKEPDHGMQG